MTTRKNRIVRKATQYNMFHLSEKNRVLNIKRHSKLKESFKKFGFIAAYPIIVKNINGKLVIYDGQHRLHFAKEFKVPVYYVEIDGAFDENDIAVINNTQKKWQYSDYAECYEKQGKKEYSNLLDFNKEFKIPLHTCVALLSGTHNLNDGKKNKYYNGDFKIEDMDFAINVARIINATRLFPTFKCSTNSRLVRAIASCSNVKNFDVERMIDRIKACPEKLINYSIKDDFISMLERIYNHKMRTAKWFPLALEAKRKDQERSIGINKK